MLVKLFYFILKIIIFPLAYLIKTNNKIWIFGAWFGTSYSDNPKYLYEYMLEQNSSLKVYWITRNKEIYNALLQKNKPVLYMRSLKGIWYVLRAKVIIMSNNLSDIHYKEFINYKTIRVQLWHGIPSKKIAFDVPSKNNNLMNNPFNYDIFISTSELIQKRFSSAFRIDISKIPITGYPRNDIFFNRQRAKNNFVVLYTPTHRMQGKGNISNYIPNEKLLKYINSFCKENSLLFKIKMHFHDEEKLKFNRTYSNIVVIKSSIDFDIQEELLNTDILITDYSSVYFDFILLDRPVIFSAFDLEEYNKNDQGNYESLENIAAGPICKNWKEILENILKLKKNPLLYQNKMQVIKDRFHKHQDGNSNKRVYEEIQKYLRNTNND